HTATAMLVITTLLVGRHEVLGGRLTAGWVVGALSLINMLGAALRDLVHAMELWVPGRVARQRIQRVLDEPVRRSAADESDSLLSPDGHLEIANFIIEGLIQAANLTANVGDRILLEGPGGSGKSSFIAALAGLVEPSSGNVSFQGRSLAEL